jgi:uncharacterized protein (TIRG00374 family)
MSRVRSPRTLAINVGLSLLAFALLGVAVYLNRDEVRTVLRHKPQWGLLATAFVIYMTGIVATFLRWYCLVRALELPFRVRDALRLGFVGNVFNLVIPGAVGGDLIKAAFLCREQDRKTQAVASMVIDRIVGLLGLFLLAGLSGFIAWPSAVANVRRLIIVLWVMVAAGFVGLAVLFTPALYHPLGRLMANRGRVQTLFNELVTMASTYRRRIGVVFVMLLFAVGIHSLYVVAFYLTSRAIFPERVPSLAAHFLIVPLALFTTALPLPFGALGVSEAFSKQLFALVNHPNGAVAMMGYRIIMYAGGLVSAIVYLFNAREFRQVAGDEQ